MLNQKELEIMPSERQLSVYPEKNKSPKNWRKVTASIAGVAMSVGLLSACGGEKEIKAEASPNKPTVTAPDTPGASESSAPDTTTESTEPDEPKNYEVDFSDYKFTVAEIKKSQEGITDYNNWQNEISKTWMDGPIDSAVQNMTGENIVSEPEKFAAIDVLPGGIVSGGQIITPGVEASESNTDEQVLVLVETATGIYPHSQINGKPGEDSTKLNMKKALAALEQSYLAPHSKGPTGKDFVFWSNVLEQEGSVSDSVRPATYEKIIYSEKGTVVAEGENGEDNLDIPARFIAVEDEEGDVTTIVTGLNTNTKTGKQMWQVVDGSFQRAV